jgi:hypothetical protein
MTRQLRLDPGQSGLRIAPRGADQTGGSALFIVQQRLK